MNLKRNFKAFINSLFGFIDEQLHKAGLTISRIRIKEIEIENITNGRSLLYKTRLEAVEAKLPLLKARIGLHALNFKPDGHINVLALKHMANQENGYSIEKLKTILADYSYYNSKTLKTGGDLLNISDFNLPNLNKLPVWFTPYPWSNTGTTEDDIKRTNFSTWIENKKRGGPVLDAFQGGAQYPLTSIERAHFEAELLDKLWRSIQKKGYKPKPYNFDPVGAILLVGKQEEWCWMVSGGIHRCSVIAALDYKMISVVVKKVIYREDVSDWPNVKNGLYSKKAALTVFDNVISGSANKHHRNWVKQTFSFHQKLG